MDRCIGGSLDMPDSPIQQVLDLANLQEEEKRKEIERNSFDFKVKDRVVTRDFIETLFENLKYFYGFNSDNMLVDVKTDNFDYVLEYIFREERGGFFSVHRKLFKEIS